MHAAYFTLSRNKNITSKAFPTISTGGNIIRCCIMRIFMKQRRKKLVIFLLITACLLLATLKYLPRSTYHDIYFSEQHIFNYSPFLILWGNFPGNLTGHKPISLLEIQNGSAVNDSRTRQRREAIKEMMRHAWNGYVKCAWGANEVRPVSCGPHTNQLFGSSSLGLTIVESLDTLHIMGMQKEFLEAKTWVQQHLDFSTVREEVSVFEFTIRFLGGLLSAYTFTKDKMFLDKASQLGYLLLPAFSTGTGLPQSVIRLAKGEARSRPHLFQNCAALAEVGSLHMEFAYLAELTGNRTFKDKVAQVREFLTVKSAEKGFYFNSISPSTGAWCSYEAGLSGMGDSFYEYLLKEALRSDDLVALNTFVGLLPFIEREMLQRSEAGKLLYLALYRWGQPMEPRMDHLACFAGGMFAMSASYLNSSLLPTLQEDSGKQQLNVSARHRWLNYGAEVAYTCRETYARTVTKLGPDTFVFSGEMEAVAASQDTRQFFLRPELVESYFYLWRITKDPKYRDWAWDVAQAINANCRVENGFSGILDVASYTPRHDDVQQSYFLAETLKYLFLTFSEDDLIPLHRWVFNTEGHPFPIRRAVKL